MDMNFCQSLETLCLNFLKSAEFASEGEGLREREKEKGKKTDQKMSKLPADIRNATICSLLSGCHADQLRMSV